MKVNVNKWILITMCILAAGALLNWFVFSYGQDDGNLLVASPKSQGIGGVPPGKLNELNDEKFMVTYKIEQGAVINALDVNYDAVIIATNCSFPFIFNLPILDGGFFTEYAQNNQVKSAVLNEKASFEAFGSFNSSGNEIKINEEKYMVSGVIRDESDQFNIYIPAREDEGYTEEFFCLLDEKADITAEYVLSQLNYIGITDAKFDFKYDKNIKEPVKEGISSGLNILFRSGSSKLEEK